MCSQDDPLAERQPSQYESEPLDRQSGTVASTSSSSLASEQLEESLSAVSLPEVGGAEASGWQLPVEPGDSLSSSMESQLAAQPPAPAAQSRQEGEEQGEERHVTGQWWCSCVAWSAPPSLPSSPLRFQYLHRGLAALAVPFYHLQSVAYMCARLCSSELLTCCARRAAL